jgi:hypothetical protein
MKVRYGLSILTEKGICSEYPGETPKNFPVKIKYCCASMKVNWLDTLFFDYWDSKVYITKDEGYNENGQIDFCPFCGLKIRIKEMYEA